MAKVSESTKFQAVPDFQSRRPLLGVNGNVFAVIGTVARGLREAGAPKAFVDGFMAEATGAKSYDEALSICMRFTDDDYVAAEKAGPRVCRVHEECDGEPCQYQEEWP